MKPLLLLLILVCTYGCKTVGDFKGVPCQDSVTLLTSENKPVECHPQASVKTAPIGSATVVVTCSCNILPAPSGCHHGGCSCSGGCDTGGCDAGSCTIDAGAID